MDGGTFDVYIRQLKNQPDETKTKKALEYFLSNSLSRTQRFNLTVVLLDYTIPQIYKLVDQSLQKLIEDGVLTIQGVGGLVNKIRTISQHTDINKELGSTYIEVLDKVFGDCLLEKLRSSNILEINEVNRLLFQGQCLAVFNEHHHEIRSTQSAFSSTDSYVTYLAHQLHSASLSHDEFNKYFVSLLSLNESSFLWIYDVFFTESEWPVLLQHSLTMKQVQKRCCGLNLIKYISRRHSDDSTQKIQALASIIKVLFNVQIVESLIETVINMLNKTLNSTLCLVLLDVEKDLPTAFKKILSTWGDLSLIKSQSIAIQESRTHFIIQLLYLLSPHFSKALLGMPEFLDSISNHLNSFSNAVKTFGVIFADKVCEIAGRENIFLMEGLEGYEYLSKSDTYAFPSDVTSPWKVLNEGMVIQHDEITADSLVQTIESLSVSKPTDDESDSDDDDPSVVSKPKLLPPIYIKQLVEYLSVNKDHPQAYEMNNLALTTGPTLIRQKAQFGTELSSVSSTLLRIMIGLGNNFDQENFEELKLNCMIAVLVASPVSGIELCKMLGNGDFSLQQRITILSALSLAARDIRGFKDDAVTNSYKDADFPTKQLPPALHAKYISMDDQAPLRLQSAHFSIQDSLIAEESEAAKDQISGGKILRISRKLTKKTTGAVPKYKDYSTIISKNFYFPLTHLWYESGGINIGHYTSILVRHYLKTMALLLHCSYSSSNSTDMVREFFIVVHDVISHIRVDELQTIEGITTGLLLICDISDEEQLLLNFGSYLIEVHTWVTENWEKIIDERIKSLCAGFLLRVAKILEKYQATMLDQVNSIY